MPAETLVCINKGDRNGCEGEVAYHTYGGRLKAFTRCEYHHSLRVAEQQRIDARYPSIQPSDFNPADAGEEW